MELGTLVASVVSSLSISAAGAWWLGGRFVEHRLSRDLERHKSSLQREREVEKADWQRGLERERAQWQKDLEAYRNLLQQDLEREKAVLQASIRREVEVYLGDVAAEREYNLEARKRLYQAIGPLKLQLLLACRDVSNRIRNHGLSRRFRIAIGKDQYYGNSTLYRLLRPVALLELIERQITYADFAVDPAALELLRLRGLFSLCTQAASRSTGIQMPSGASRKSMSFITA